MQTPEIAPRPGPVPVVIERHPVDVAASTLVATIHEHSTDADSFAANVQRAIAAMGIPVPPMFASMIAAKVAEAWGA